MRRSFPTAIALCLFAAACSAQAIRSPWDGHPIRFTDAPAVCPELPPVPADLTTDGFYRIDDPTHSIIDPKRMEAYKQSSGPPKTAALLIVHEADLFRQTGSRVAARCAMLNHLAQANALGGRMSSSQAYYVQGWLAGAMAIAFLKVRESGLATAQQSADIAAWLKHLGESTRQWYDAELARHPDGNNHLYWAGLQLCATAAVANDRSDFKWCIVTYRNGIRQIATDGTLPLEMARGSRALHYHLYALAPLVLIAEFGEDNGLPLYAENNNALAKLVQVCLAGVDDPALFVQRTGRPQEVPKRMDGDDIAWAPPYEARFPSPLLAREITSAHDLSSFYMGGLPVPGVHAR
jgi:poly(beta-D-mannuronate) lyase